MADAPVDRKKLVEENGKRCPGCNTHKVAEEFSVAKDRYDGRGGYCKACMRSKYAETKSNYELTRAGKARKQRHKRSELKKKRQQLDEQLRRTMDALARLLEDK